jgi:uncharacterized protein (DUF885 family)
MTSGQPAREPRSGDAGTRSSAPELDAWLDGFFASYYRHRPVNATFIGLHVYDDRLPDLSAHGLADVLGDGEDLLRRLRALPDEHSTEAQALDRRLAEGFLRIQQWEAGSIHFGPGSNPTLFTGEAIFGLVSLLLRPFAPLEQRLHMAAARLGAVPALLATGSRQIRSAPAAWIERARHECEGARLLLADVAAEHAVLEHPARAASLAFNRFDHHLARKVAPSEEYACGGEALDLLLRYAHFVPTGADALERLALERIAEEQLALAALGPASPPAELLEDSTEPYLERFERWWRAACDLAEERDLVTVPDWPVRFVERPTWARRAAPHLYFLPYRSPAPFDDAPVVEYLAPPGSDESTIKLNHVVHHGSIGHHIQNWFAGRAASRLGQIAAVDCASRIAMLCGGTMAEGWANYATDLVEESSPDFLTASERDGQHRAKLRMAARAVVDIRLHQGRITLEEAIVFYTECVGMAPAAARAEAIKNSLFPGAACMYLIGWDGIWRLRRALQTRDPAGFSLRAFHDRFLSFGSVPLSLIAQVMLEAAAVPALPIRMRV